MKFGLLFRDALRYLIRARLLYLALGFSTLLHWGGLKALKNLTFSFQGVVGGVGPREGMFVSLFLSLFMGIFLAAVYGIWMAPQAHRGPRSLLTFVLPVPKVLYPLVYLSVFLLPLILEFGIMAVSFSSFYGSDIWQGRWFSVSAILTCLAIEGLACLTIMLIFSILALTVGQVMTLFIGVFGFFIFQVAGMLMRIGHEAEASVGSGWKTFGVIYQGLPPLGDLIFYLKQTFSKGGFPTEHILLWILWLGVLVGVFRWRIRYPLTTRSTES